MIVSYPHQFLLDLRDFEVIRRTAADILASGIPLGTGQRDMYEGLEKLKLVDNFEDLVKTLDAAVPDENGLVHIPVV